MSISKSGVKGSDCEHYFAGYFLDGVRQIPQGFTETGTAFHRYRCEYVDHLIDIRTDKDRAWVETWARSTPLDADARELILGDAEMFYLDPDKVYGTEVFLCVDVGFQPLKGIDRPAPGQQPSDKRSFAHGTIDRIDLLGDHLALVSDYKAGFLFKSDEREAAIYALLVFCHFPAVEKVTFSWDFIRAGASHRTNFERAELDLLKGMAIAWDQQQKAIAAKMQSGQLLDANPFAGLCTYCDLQCPLRWSVALGQFPAGPISTEKEALGVVAMLRAVKKNTASLETMLKAWLGEHGPLATPGDKPAEIKGGSSLKVSLEGFLDLLGVAIDPERLNHRVPLDRLRVGLTELKPLLKKNDGLAQACEERFEREPYSRLSL